MYALGNYNLTQEQYRRLLRVAEEKLEFLYRVSVNGDRVQFCAMQDFDLSQLERDALELYYNKTFTGHFRSSSYPARVLMASNMHQTKTMRCITVKSMDARPALNGLF